jgi:hypothetical protein
MSERVRIRSRRNQEASKQAPLSQRKLSDTSASLFEVESVRSKMIQTTKEWYKGLRKDKKGR